MKQSPEMFVITVWRTDVHGTVQYPPLERYVKECRGVADLKRESKAASDRYIGKEYTKVTSGFVMEYLSNEEPKIRGLKQWWASEPFTTTKDV